MECNREEALRAREIAAKRLENKDFLGARRIALKAQRLSPELENIHGLLTVCEVHCAAVEKINEDLDWYSILQVEATADDTVIRKQYDKLAFWLQPDKTTLSGAEVALKLVSEAREILCDRTKRALYDIKRQYASQHVVSKATQLSNKTGANRRHADGCKQSPACVLVFWTICPHCQRRFVYYKRNFLVLCDDCGKLFFAFKLHEQAVPLSFLSDSANNTAESPSLRRSAKRKQDVDASSSLNSDSKKKQRKNDFPSNADLNLKQTIDENVSNAARQSVQSNVPSKVDIQGNAKTARKNQDADGSSSLNSNSKNKQRKNDFPINPDLFLKQIFDENVCNAARQSVPSNVPSKVVIQENAKTTDIGNQDNMEAEVTDTVGQDQPCYSKKLYFPDAYLFDFEKLREVNLFSVGQIWAIYDDLDVMPRYYARIQRFDASNFEVHLTWLEHVATNESEDKWTDEELPVACGSFSLGTTEISQERFMFSHIVSWTEGKKGNYEIYPSKGEIWALYRGWSMQWVSDADSHRSYEYEVVEVLSNFSVSAGVTIAPLVRIKGFGSLFATAKDKSEIVVASSELLSFSHSIPFYRTDGSEIVGVPGGLLQLDLSCLPEDLDAAFSSVTLDSCMSPDKKEGSPFIDLSTLDSCMSPDKKEGSAFIDLSTDSPSSRGKHEDISSEQNTCSQKIPHGPNALGDLSHKKCPSPRVYTYPDSEFYDFEECRSCVKFERGQIWAIYSDFDKFPKFYGRINKVELEPFKVDLTIDMA